MAGKSTVKDTENRSPGLGRQSDYQYHKMKTSKWLASSVILFILLRVFVRSAPLPKHDSDYDRQEERNNSNEKVLSRSKRFSMNEYLMIAISVFNIFVLLYNNIETFFPQRNSLSKTVVANSVDLNQANADSGFYESTLDLPLSASQISPAAPLSRQASAQRDETIDQIAEMLIRGEISTEQVPEDIRWEVVQNLNAKMQDQRSMMSQKEYLPNFNNNLTLSEETTERVLSRQKRQFPVFGFLSFLMLLVNSVLLINENINVNRDRSYQSNLTFTPSLFLQFN